MALNWFKKLKSGLSKSASKVEGAIASITGKKTLDQKALDNIEDQLILADLGIEVAALSKYTRSVLFTFRSSMGKSSLILYTSNIYRSKPRFTPSLLAISEFILFFKLGMLTLSNTLFAKA